MLTKISTILTRGEQPKNMKNQKRSLLIFKREAPKTVRRRAFVRFAQWLIRPCVTVVNIFSVFQ